MILFGLFSDKEENNEENVEQIDDNADEETMLVSFAI